MVTPGLTKYWEENGAIVMLMVYLSARSIVLFMPGIATYLPYQCRHRNIEEVCYGGTGMLGRYAMLQRAGMQPGMLPGMLCCRYAGMPGRRKNARRSNRLSGAFRCIASII